MPVEFYSTEGEDNWIVESIDIPSEGTVVEVGVGHWQNGSNSLLFEQIGWNTVLVEPHPNFHAGILANRRAKLFPCAAGSFDGVTPFMLNETPTWSGIARTDGERIEVPIRRLSSILDEAGIYRIDILSIDTEGTELDVWAGLDLSRHRPQIVIMEWQTAGIPEDPMKILRRILPDGYALVNAAGGNFIFQNTRK